MELPTGSEASEPDLPEDTMRVVERIQLRHTAALSILCHGTKNLYNLANYLVRQRFTKSDPEERRWMRYEEIYALVKFEGCYRALPPQTAQQTLILLDRNWKSFFASIREWRATPGKFAGRPKLPKYLRKDGETIAIFTSQTCRLRYGRLRFPEKTGIPSVRVRDTITGFHQVRILPRNGRYILEIVHDRTVEHKGLDPSNAIGVDIGVNNLLTAAGNTGIAPVIARGRGIKSVNRLFNKRVAHLSSVLNKRGKRATSRQLDDLRLYRLNRIRDELHKASRALIAFCVENNIGTIAIGKNDGWKQNVDMGKRNNQNFVQIPFNDLIDMIQYKAALVGIRVIVVGESHTSKCSALDGEEIGHHDAYKGKRIRRGLFRSADGRLINADVNAAFNILRRAVPGAIDVLSPSQMLQRPLYIN